MNQLTFLIGVFISTISFSQSSIFNSAFKGNSFVQIGSSLHYMTPSTLHFTGNNFDFSLNHSVLSNKGSTTSQPLLRQALSVEFGHNIRRGVLLSLNWDQMGYGLTNQVLEVTGNITPGIDNLSGLPATSNNTLVSMDTIGFTFNVGRSNRVTLQANLCQNLFRTAKRGFVINAVYGLGAGIVHSTSTTTFGSALQPNIKSLSGFSVAANAGLRFEFLRHFYVLTNLSGVMLSNQNLRLDVSDGSQSVKGTLGYGQATVFVGSVFSFKNRKSCDCPKF